MSNFTTPLGSTYSTQPVAWDFNAARTTQPLYTTPVSQPVVQPTIAQPQVRTQPNVIPGRIIQNEADIKANEVPMDGNFGTFVQNDLSRVYLKTWGNDGLIHTNAYVLEQPNSQSNQDPLQMIMERLDRIENQLSNRGKNRNQNKEGNNHEQ